jgi:hypothetical protein
LEELQAYIANAGVGYRSAEANGEEVSGQNVDRHDDAFFLQEIDEEKGIIPPDDTEGALRANGDEAKVHKYIRKMSSLIKDPNEFTIDEKRLASAMKETGENAFGILAIEVFDLDHETDTLIRPKGAWWYNSSLSDSEALSFLETAHRANNSVIPGVGVVGSLWSGFRGLNQHPALRFSRGSLGSLANLRTASTLSLQSHHEAFSLEGYQDTNGGSRYSQRRTAVSTRGSWA